MSSVTSAPLCSVQLRESPTLLDFSWVNIPHWGKRSCVHTWHSARSARGPHGRRENGWSDQARVRVGTAVKSVTRDHPPSAESIKPLWRDTGLGCGCGTSTPPCVHKAFAKTHTRWLRYAILRLPVREIDSVVLKKRQSRFTERNIRVKWRNRTPTGHLPTSGDRPWLIINLCEANVAVDVTEIIRFP